MFNFLDRLDGVECHMDNLLAYSFESKDEHSDRVHKMLKCLKNHGVTLNKKKCFLCKSSVKLLDHVISERRVNPDLNSTQNVLKLPAPTCSAQ